MRNNPQSILPHVTEALEQYNKPNLPQDSYLQNFFSHLSFQDTIELCKDKEAVTNQLRWCPDLAKAAQDHVLELGPKGMELYGSPGRGLSQRDVNKDIHFARLKRFTKNYHDNGVCWMFRASTAPEVAMALCIKC